MENNEPWNNGSQTQRCTCSSVLICNGLQFQFEIDYQDRHIGDCSDSSHSKERFWTMGMGEAVNFTTVYNLICLSTKSINHDRQ